MPTILMPALSPTMEEGKLSKWLVKEGDTVKPGDVLAEIETQVRAIVTEAADFATNDVEPDAAELWTDIYADA